MMDCVSLSVFLLALVSSSGTQSSSEDYFYLTLVSAPEEGGSGSGAEVLLGSGLGSSNTSTSQCVFKSEEVPVRCSCGYRLEEATSDHRDFINSTCVLFDELQNPDSPFSFCENSLLTLGNGYQIEKRPVLSLFPELEVFTEASLRERVEQLERQLLVFRQVLDRTITGALIGTDSDKCFCLVSYICFVQERVCGPSCTLV